MRAVVFDTETTGLLLPARAPLEKQPRVIELGAAIVEDGKIVDTVSELISPGFQITDEITRITGITNEDLIGRPRFEAVLERLREIMRGADVGYAHNAPFDTGVIGYELQRLGCDDFQWPERVVCTVQEYVPVFGRRPRMTELYERVVGKPLEQTHRALDDAMALHEILEAGGYYAED